MKDWFKGLPRDARRVFAACSVITATLFLYTSSRAIGWYVNGSAIVDELRPQIARLKGYKIAQSDLSRSATEAEKVLRSLAYSGDKNVTKVGAEFQQVLRQYAEESGLTVSGSRLSVDSAGDDQEGVNSLFDVMTVELSLVGVPMAFEAFLQSLESHQPQLASIALDVQRPRRSPSRTGQVSVEALNAVLKVVALRDVSTPQ